MIMIAFDTHFRLGIEVGKKTRRSIESLKCVYEQRVTMKPFVVLKIFNEKFKFTVFERLFINGTERLCFVFSPESQIQLFPCSICYVPTDTQIYYMFIQTDNCFGFSSPIKTVSDLNKINKSIHNVTGSQRFACVCMYLCIRVIERVECQLIIINE